MNGTPLSLAGSLADWRADDGTMHTPAFRRLLDQVCQENDGRLARLVVAMGFRGEQVGDMLQDVYVMALAKPPAMDDEQELLPWLFRVTINRCHLEHRRRARWRRLWTGLARAWNGALATNTTYDGELKHQVEKSLKTLSDDDRALVALRYFSDLNSRQIAEIVGMPEASVRGRLRVARRKLAEELADWDDSR
jgi:RNA polymerase sigma-70 factor, ECF subfamily